MQLDNSFSIPVPAAQAWPVLLDLERIAPCVPGATLTGRDGEGFLGRIKVKLGPVGLSYTGTIRVVSADEKAGVAVLEGGGRETRGNGTAKATITCRLVESGDNTNVFVETDLNITGKPAQFGRGALAEVAGTLIGRFAENLAAEITAGAQDSAQSPESPMPAADPSTHDVDTSSPARLSSTPHALGVTVAANPARTAPAHRAPAEPIDVLAASGIGRITLYGPVLAVIALLLIVLLSRRRHGHTSED
ncbi:SRPBCC family protein [Nocardia alni]|uniref:SRPBCC family protein n=1 Tax=Nocardia alni TaxID=2815723 RepID=UPI001C2387B7|nr:SRPBCC family protein [Nocardia alni]